MLPLLLLIGSQSREAEENSSMALGPHLLLQVVIFLTASQLGPETQ